MLDVFIADNVNDADGNPAGGSVIARGLEIHWQNGPLGREGDRKQPNGALVETVIAAAKQRLEYYQRSKFACPENAQAVEWLNVVLALLNKRTTDREARQVEGTHAV